MANLDYARLNRLRVVGTHVDIAFDLLRNALLEGFSVDMDESMWIEMETEIARKRERAAGRIERLVLSEWES
jgi:hypothetical protein